MLAAALDWRMGVRSGRWQSLEADRYRKRHMIVARVWLAG
jgi:hypothetical protein